MWRRKILPPILAVLFVVAACDGQTSDSGAAGEDDASTDASTPSSAASVAPSGGGFDAANFDDDSATVDNPWFPLEPGKSGISYILEGFPTFL